MKLENIGYGGKWALGDTLDFSGGGENVVNLVGVACEEG